jgi:hypothetical protein
LIKEFKETRAKEENIKVKLKGLKKQRFRKPPDSVNHVSLNIIMMLQKKDW